MNCAHLVALELEGFAVPVPYWMTWHVAIDTEAVCGEVFWTLNEAVVVSAAPADIV